MIADRLIAFLDGLSQEDLERLPPARLMREPPNSNLPPPHVLEALRRPRWLQEAMLMTSEQRDTLWRVRNPIRGPRPEPSWASNYREDW